MSSPARAIKMLLHYQQSTAKSTLVILLTETEQQFSKSITFFHLRTKSKHEAQSICPKNLVYIFLFFLFFLFSYPILFFSSGVKSTSAITLPLCSSLSESLPITDWRASVCKCFKTLREHIVRSHPWLIVCVQSVTFGIMERSSDARIFS